MNTRAAEPQPSETERGTSPVRSRSDPAALGQVGLQLLPLEIFISNSTDISHFGLLPSWACRRITTHVSDATPFQDVLTSTPLRQGRFLFRLVAVGLMGAGLFVLLQSPTGRFLSHDLRYVGLDRFQPCGLREGRVAYFMFHDRVSFGGVLIAIGLLYLWLEQVPLKAGEAWAWWTFLFSG